MFKPVERFIKCNELLDRLLDWPQGLENAFEQLTWLFEPTRLA